MVNQEGSFVCASLLIEKSDYLLQDGMYYALL